MKGLPPPLLLACGVALALRLLGAVLAAVLPCHADECWYVELARAFDGGLGILTDRGHLWPPLYVLFLAAWTRVDGVSLFLVRSSQALVSAATLVPSFLLARRAFGERVATGTTWLLVLSPTLIAFSHYLWPETLHLFLFVTSLALLFEVRRRLDRGEAFAAIAVAAGFFFALACLTKAIHFYFLVFALPWLCRAARERRRAGAAAGLVLAASLATIAPWSLYASARFGRFVALEATLGVNLWRGNNTFLPFDADFGANRAITGGYPPCDDPNPIDRDRCNASRALRFIAANPLLFVERIPTKMADLWTPTSFLVRHLRLGLYGELPRWLVEPIVALDVGSALVLAIGAALGLACPIPSAREHDDARAFRSLVALLLLYTCIVHVATFGMSRFRIPLLPFLAPFAARAWLERGRLIEITRRPRLLAATAGAIVALVVIWLCRLESVWPRGAA